MKNISEHWMDWRFHSRAGKTSPISSALSFQLKCSNLYIMLHTKTDITIVIKKFAQMYETYFVTSSSLRNCQWVLTVSMLHLIMLHCKIVMCILWEVTVCRWTIIYFVAFHQEWYNHLMECPIIISNVAVW